MIDTQKKQFKKFSIRDVIKTKDSRSLSGKFIILVILISPIIDLFNGLLLDKVPISPGQIIRPLFMLVGLYILLMFRKKSFIYFSIVAFFMVLSLSIYTLLFGGSTFSNLVWDFRLLFTLTIVLVYVNFLRIQKKKFVKKVLLYVECTIAFIAAVIVISSILNIGFNTYTANNGVGNKGFFIGQNDVTSIFSMIFPILLVQFITIRTNRILRIVNLTLVIFATILLGTKSGMAFILLGAILVLAFHFKEKNFHEGIFKDIKRKKKQIITIITLILSALIIFVLVFKSSLLDWLSYQLYFLNHSNNFLTYLLSGRNKSIQPMFEILIENPIFILIGSTFQEGQNLLSQKLGFPAFVEFDPLSVLFYNGIIVFSLILILFLYLFKKSFKLFKGDIYNKAIGISFWIGVLYSSLGGHVFPSGISGSYFAMICGLVIYFPVKEEVKIANRQS
ncbi:O-antigen ligase family protein [Bacillus sp. 1P02SD]|uniref:O-antigen ligase family protein n=1 Tax=Bacillus sp. 1P02SD TaxID=3132264 RepID=UPI0039A22A44